MTGNVYNHMIMETQENIPRKPNLIKPFSVSILIIALLACPIPLKAKEAYPDDQPTIEALIGYHKALKKAEESSKKKLEESTIEQSFTEKASKKFNEVRSTLDSKLNNVYSYVILAASLTKTSVAVYKAIEEYTDYTKMTANYLKKYPFAAFYFTNANYAISKEVKRMKNNIAIFAASETGIWRAPMNDKVNMLLQLQTSVQIIRGYINNGRWFCLLMSYGNWKPDYIWEILNSDVTEAIAKRVIEEWCRNT